MADIFDLHSTTGSEGHHDSADLLHHDLAGLHEMGDHGIGHIDILGNNTDVPWLHFCPAAAHHDADHDGILDSVDHFVGPGADQSISIIGGGQTDVPWINFGPYAMHHDSDLDGLPDALDHHVGPGAHDLHPGAFSTGVPWQQITLESMHYDTDHDGIPDALDNRVGPGDT
jgi:hypothetical protein